MTPIQPLDRTSATFRADVDTLFEVQLPLLTTELNEVIEQAESVTESKIAAAASASAAAASATAASQTANAVKWISGTNYGEGVGVWSPANFQTYRRKVAGSGSLDPSLDPTNWASLSSGSVSSQTLTDGATVNWNAALGEIATVTLGGNRTLAAPTNLKPGTYVLHVKQDATGGRGFTLPAIFKFPEDVAPQWSTLPNRCDVVSGVYDGTYIRSTYLRGFTS